MTTLIHNETILVLGGTGTTGRRIAERLSARGVPARACRASRTRARRSPDATGRDVRFVPMPIDEFTSVLVEQQLPADAVALITYIFAEVLDGHSESLADGVQRALGRQPRDFREYARVTAATGVWNG